MKRFLALVFTLVIIISVGVFAEEIENIIPDESIWGISADTLKDNYPADYEKCQVEEDEAWRVSNVEVCSYDMDVYYVFEGTTNAQLSKIAYILNVSDFDTDTELDECLQVLVNEMKRIAGEPDSVKKNTTIWKTEQYKAELGKGKLSKYTGSDKATVALIFKKGNVKKPSKTPEPTKEADSSNKNSSGIWMTKSFVDEFNDPTGEYYLVSNLLNGTFSNSATKDSKLSACIFYLPSSNSVAIRLLEYGDMRVNNPFSENTKYDLIFKDADGKKYSTTGFMYSKSEDVYFEGGAVAGNLVYALMKGNTVRFSLSEQGNSLTKYVFSIPDADGFEEAYYAMAKIDPIVLNEGAALYHKDHGLGIVKKLINL